MTDYRCFEQLKVSPEGLEQSNRWLEDDPDRVLRLVAKWVKHLSFSYHRESYMAITDGRLDAASHTARRSIGLSGGGREEIARGRRPWMPYMMSPSFTAARGGSRCRHGTMFQRFEPNPIELHRDRVLVRREMELLEAGAKEWGLALNSDQLEAFELYYQQLMVWNERASLTAITDYEDVQVKHFLDSLSCLQVLTDLAPGTRCIDIGAGAGFPGLPLRIVCPQMRLTLLEATRKKVLFLEHMVKELGLRDVEVIQGRAEELGRQAGHREVYDVALARAVAELSVLLEYALPLLQVEGIFVAQKGGEVEDELEAAGPAMNVLGGYLKEVREVRLPGLDDARRLVVVEKVARTPDKYPRRPGMPGKRPLKVP